LKHFYARRISYWLETFDSVMLKPTSQNVKICYEKALAAAQQAANARKAADRKFWLDRERQWLKLATYYEYSGRLTAFIGELRSAPKQPICSACDVLMGIRRLHCRSDGSTEYHYECPGCEAKQTVVDIDADPRPT